MVVAVFASVAAEAGVGMWRGCVVCVFVMYVLVMCVFVMIVMGNVRWLNCDFHGDWSLLVNGEGDLLLVNDWTIDWNVNVIRHGLLNDIRDLLDDFNWCWDWNLHWNVNVLFDLNWIRSVNFDVNWERHFFDDLHWVRFLDLNWVWGWDMNWVGSVNWNLHFIRDMLHMWDGSWNIDLLDNFDGDFLFVNNWVRGSYVNWVWDLLDDFIGSWHINFDWVWAFNWNLDFIRDFFDHFIRHWHMDGHFDVLLGVNWNMFHNFVRLRHIHLDGIWDVFCNFDGNVFGHLIWDWVALVVSDGLLDVGLVTQIDVSVVAVVMAAAVSASVMMGEWRTFDHWSGVVVSTAMVPSADISDV